MTELKDIVTTKEQSVDILLLCKIKGDTVYKREYANVLRGGGISSEWRIAKRYSLGKNEYPAYTDGELLKLLPGSLDKENRGNGGLRIRKFGEIYHIDYEDYVDIEGDTLLEAVYNMIIQLKRIDLLPA